MSSTQVQTTYAHKLRSFRDLVPDGYQVRLDADTRSAPGDERTQRLDLFFGKEAASLHPGEDELQVKGALLSAFTCMTADLSDKQAEVVDTYFTVNDNAVSGQTDIRSIARGFNIDDLVRDWTIEEGTKERIFNQEPQETFQKTWIPLVDAPTINIKEVCDRTSEKDGQDHCCCLPLRAVPSAEGRDIMGQALRGELSEERQPEVKKYIRELTTTTASGLAEKWEDNCIRINCPSRLSNRFIQKVSDKADSLDPRQPWNDKWEFNLP